MILLIKPIIKVSSLIVRGSVVLSSTSKFLKQTQLLFELFCQYTTAKKLMKLYEKLVSSKDIKFNTLHKQSLCSALDDFYKKKKLDAML